MFAVCLWADKWVWVVNALFIYFLFNLLPCWSFKGHKLLSSYIKALYIVAFELVARGEAHCLIATVGAEPKTEKTKFQ